jgi:hypothetical protein
MLSGAPQPSVHFRRDGTVGEVRHLDYQLAELQIERFRRGLHAASLMRTEWPRHEKAAGGPGGGARCLLARRWPPPPYYGAPYYQPAPYPPESYFERYRRGGSAGCVTGCSDQ